MIYDLIAEFYENLNDRGPRYRVPVNTICVDSVDELLNMGFEEDVTVPPGDIDYYLEVTEEELESWSNEDSGIEVIPVLDGHDYARILVHAYEVETFDGEVPPRGFRVGDHDVFFTGIKDDDIVIFRYGERDFIRPLETLKKRFGFITMFEVMDYIRYVLSRPITHEGVRAHFGSGLDEAIRLAAVQFCGECDLDGNPAVLHAIEVGQMGQTEDEKIVGYLHDVVEDTDVTLDDLDKMGFETEVIESVRLLTRQDDVDYFDYIKNILDHDIDTAINVKINDLLHNIKRGYASAERAESDGDKQKFEEIMRINAKHERALQMIYDDRERNK